MPSTHKLNRRMKRRTKMVMKKMLANELSLVVLKLRMSYSDKKGENVSSRFGAWISLVKRMGYTSATVCDMMLRTQGVPDPSSDVRDPRAAPARDLFLVRDSIRQLASDDQGVPDQATKDVRDPIEATRSIPARVPFVSSSRLNSFGGPIQQSSKVKR
ncbi:hypothetical protein F2Q70_00003539 [Brassica cretica]|uniref:Uncharacterized protein n=1 Tax=Brassica cretica TaxID=69181 RepID=A0A8S9INT7_BRACR|nr:hypothetical protein F2Q70_00003539 [Brassica cretica]